MTKKTFSKFEDFRIVPNDERGSALQSRKAARAAASLIAKELDDLSGSRLYEKVRIGKTDLVRVRDRNSKKVLSEFRIDPAEKYASVRKLRVKLAPGTVSPKKIFDSI